MTDTSDLRLLFHRLNNQLGIILSHAELLEAKSREDLTRSRATHVVAGVLEAMNIAKEIRARTIVAPPQSLSRPASIRRAG